LQSLIKKGKPAFFNKLKVRSMHKYIPIFLLLLLSSCSTSKIVRLSTEGSSLPEKFSKELSFEYRAGHIYVDVLLSGRNHTFLYDTGYDLTTLDKNMINEITFVPLRKMKTSGSSFEDHKIQYGFLSQLTIAEVTYRNIGIGLQDLSHIKSPFPDHRKISGIIGANVLRKAFWQLNYQDRILKFSDDIANLDLGNESISLPIKAKTKSAWGNTRTPVLIDGREIPFVFDTGSSGRFTANFELLRQLEIGQKIRNEGARPILVRDLNLGEIELPNEEISMENGVGYLIGNRFLEDYMVTIDWQNETLYLCPNRNESE